MRTSETASCSPPEGKAAVAEIFSTFSEVYTFFHRFLRLSQDEAHSQAIRFITEFPQDTCERLRAVVRKLSKRISEPIFRNGITVIQEKQNRKL